MFSADWELPFYGICEVQCVCVCVTGMFMTGAGRIQHSGAKQMWEQDYVQAYGITIRQVRRYAGRWADPLTHFVGELSFEGPPADGGVMPTEFQCAR